MPERERELYRNLQFLSRSRQPLSLSLLSARAIRFMHLSTRSSFPINTSVARSGAASPVSTTNIARARSREIAAAHQESRTTTAFAATLLPWETAIRFCPLVAALSRPLRHIATLHTHTHTV